MALAVVQRGPMVRRRQVQIAQAPGGDAAIGEGVRRDRGTISTGSSTSSASDTASSRRIVGSREIAGEVLAGAGPDQSLGHIERNSTGAQKRQPGREQRIRLGMFALEQEHGSQANQDTRPVNRKRAVRLVERPSQPLAAFLMTTVGLPETREGRRQPDEIRRRSLRIQPAQRGEEVGVIGGQSIEWRLGGSHQYQRLQ